jgi:hypothetical protein
MTPAEGMGLSKMMDVLMLNVIRNHKIVGAIIRLIPVDVMHDLIRSKCATQHSLHNASMFHAHATVFTDA